MCTEDRESSVGVSFLHMQFTAGVSLCGGHAAAVPGEGTHHSRKRKPLFSQRRLGYLGIMTFIL